MYKLGDMNQQRLAQFHLSFGGKLKRTNRWITLSEIIPWEDFEKEYSLNFSKTRGAPSLSFRIALGSLIIKERLNLSDVETVEQIEENPYMQYFLGFEGFISERPFDSSSLTHFRKRISPELISKMNEKIIEAQLFKTKEKEISKKSDDDDQSNNGTMTIDATCAPSDIRYPTDISLLNECRINSEKIIDTLWNEAKRFGVDKPRTYRKKARKDFLSASKAKRLSIERRRKLIKKQLNYLKRNASTIESMGNLTILSKKEYKQFLVIKEVYRQQSELYNENKRSIKDRIVNAAQPYIRPIVRGKAGKPVEFGAKISAALVNGFVYLDRFSFDSYNESTDLKLHIKKYKKRFGVLPSKILADQIYRTRYNRKFCKKLGIELSGKPLGRPPKNGFSKNEKMRWQNNEKERSLIEGKFGQLKRRFSLGRIMAKLAYSTNTIAEIAFLVVNLEKILALGDFLYSFINMIVELIDNKKFQFSNSKLSLVIIQ